jgi:hypothetical protein
MKKPKSPRDPIQIARSDFGEMLTRVVDSPTVPIAPIAGYRPEWSNKGRKRRIAKARRELSDQGLDVVEKSR